MPMDDKNVTVPNFSQPWLTLLSHKSRKTMQNTPKFELDEGGTNPA